MITSASRGKRRNADLYVTRPLWTSQSFSAEMRHASRQPARQHAARPRATKDSGRWLPELLAIFAILNIGDLASTFIGLTSGMHEGNPLMSTLLAHFGFGALVVYKALVIVAVTAGIYVLRAFHPSIATVTIWVCNALVLGVVILNIVQYFLLH